MYKAKVNKNSEYSFSENTNNDVDSVWNSNIIKESNNSWKINLGDTASYADVEEIDVENKKVTIKINQNRYDVEIKEPVDLKLEKLGIHVVTKKKLKNLVAPMPGLVLKIMVEPGQEIKQGEPLIVLEAMKMENVFKSAADVVIKQICVEEKTAVEKGQELIIFE